jgi:drug/metabolite transporter (DMT)-like permease
MKSKKEEQMRQQKSIAMTMVRIQNLRHIIHTKDQSKWTGHAVAILTVACWGGTFINTKYLLMGGMQPHEIFFVRFLLAYLCIWFISPRKLFCNNWKDELTMLLLGITGGSLYFWAENTAVQLTFVNDVSFIICMAPLFTIFFATIFLKNVKVSQKLITGSAIALAGVAIVIFNGHFVLHLNPSGDALALLASFCWGIYSLVIKRVSGKYSTSFITRKVFFYGILTILPAFLFQHWSFPLSGLEKPIIWLNLFFLGVVASFACYLMWNWSVRKIGALKTANYNYLNPISTVVLSAIFLKESITPIAFLGGILILIGIFMSNRSNGI